MPNPEWGVKRACPSCTTRFYDLNTDPATCPACKSVFTLDQLTLKRGKAERPDPKVPARVVPEDIEVDPDVIEAEDDIDVGDDLLEDDEDDGAVPLEEIGDVAGEEPET